MTSESPSKWNVAEWFVLSQTFLPALLYLPGTQPFRVPIRIAAYGLSLAILAHWLTSRPKSGKFHPAVVWLLWAMAYLALMLFHPTTNSFVAGIAQIGLYLSVFAPLLWAPAYVEDPRRLYRLLWILLLCTGINSVVGILQVRDPARWLPAEFSSVTMGGTYGLGVVSYQGPDGRTIIRPPGLMDAPGAVCGPATFALFLGIAFAVLDKRWSRRLMAGGLAVAGAAAIFLTLVRSSFLVACGMITIFFLLQIRQINLGRAIMVGTIAVLAIGAAFLYSASIGGGSIVTRFKTITAENPTSFYYKNRGAQLENGLMEMLPKYPLGAGLGRWGMMNNYFGDKTNRVGSAMWAEIQIPAWIIDGGVVLLALYAMALLVTFAHHWRLATQDPNDEIRSLATLIFAANAGTAILCFSYPVFCSPSGAQFWFLAGALLGLERHGSEQRLAGDDESEPAVAIEPEEQGATGVGVQRS